MSNEAVIKYMIPPYYLANTSMSRDVVTILYVYIYIYIYIHIYIYICIPSQKLHLLVIWLSCSVEHSDCHPSSSSAFTQTFCTKNILSSNAVHKSLSLLLGMFFLYPWMPLLFRCHVSCLYSHGERPHMNGTMMKQLCEPLFSVIHHRG